MLKFFIAVKQLLGGSPSSGVPTAETSADFTVRLAALPTYYTMIVPADLATLIREAKHLYPEVAQHAIRKEVAIRHWIESARPMSSAHSEPEANGQGD